MKGWMERNAKNTTTIDGAFTDDRVKSLARPNRKARIRCTCTESIAVGLNGKKHSSRRRVRVRVLVLVLVLIVAYDAVYGGVDVHYAERAFVIADQDFAGQGVAHGGDFIVDASHGVHHKPALH